jgi:hypothetical protein
LLLSKHVALSSAVDSVLVVACGNSATRPSLEERVVKYLGKILGVGVQSAVTFLEKPGSAKDSSLCLCIIVVLYSLAQDSRVSPAPKIYLFIATLESSLEL